jgi:hypothetical protein
VPLVKELIKKTETKTGLRVTVDVLNKVCETGRKAAKQLQSTLNIISDAVLPKWNYVLSPQT